MIERRLTIGEILPDQSLSPISLPALLVSLPELPALPGRHRFWFLPKTDSSLSRLFFCLLVRCSHRGGELTRKHERVPRHALLNEFKRWVGAIYRGMAHLPFAPILFVAPYRNGFVSNQPMKGITGCTPVGLPGFRSVGSRESNVDDASFVSPQRDGIAIMVFDDATGDLELLMKSCRGRCMRQAGCTHQDDAGKKAIHRSDFCG